MSGHHPFSELTKNFTPERRQRVDAKKGELLAKIPLHELRLACNANPTRCFPPLVQSLPTDTSHSSQRHPRTKE